VAVGQDCARAVDQFDDGAVVGISEKVPGGGVTPEGVLGLNRAAARIGCKVLVICWNRASVGAGRA
ncbi:MAG: hypothetical protein ACRDUX_39820, partial [Mycobacterium sp.]